ncbi:MAG: hypothetical protein Q8R08_00015 [bacterium]|nr:hypothetical protein [bacterium]
MTELRLALCDCSNRYQGKFEVLEIVAKGRLFRIKEIVVGNPQRETLRGTMSHMFLDLHERRESDSLTTQVSLKFLEYISNGEGLGFRLHIGGVFPFDKEILWTGQRPVAPRRILQGMERLIESLPENRFQKWLTVTSL